MAPLICYEGWDITVDRVSHAAELLALARLICPSLRSCHLAIAGKGSQIRCSIESLHQRIDGLESSWSVTILGPAERMKGAPFAVSDPVLDLVMHRSFRGFYLYGGCAAGLMRNATQRMNFISQLVRRSGTGFGYFAEFANPLDATMFAADRKVRNISAVLGLQRKKNWEESLRSAPEQHPARNLFPINIWPRYYLERVQANSTAWTCLIAQGANLARLLSDGCAVVTIPPPNLTEGRACLARHLFETSIAH